MAIPLVKKAYNSPWWIPALSIVAVLSLAGTLVLFLLFASDQRDERARSRDTDRELCSFANDLRADVRSIGKASREMVQGIIDEFLPPDATNGERAAAIAEFRERLEPVFQQHRDAVANVEDIDCQTVIGTASREFP
jgi:phosphoserine phosphatase